MATSSLVLTACAGFLLAVLWMDLMFDVQVLRHQRDADLPEAVLASIAAYYRRVTTTARPMGHAVGTVMAVLLVTLVVEITSGDGARGVALASLALAAGPIALAALRVVPNAVRLGSRADPLARQSALARSICRDHLVCLAGIVAFLALQLALGARA
ncbi:MAG TPA: hypothetical protein VMS55_04485 [Myxococcota bacterium]|nr:hypothetical protein [Myxococcota bacterium]